MDKIIVNPDPKRLIEGLRDTGYSFNVAVADLIDNSIAAYAHQIKLFIDMDYEGSINLQIVDDGDGMSKDKLITAMKYGSPPDPNPRSLGKFGLGMKTASTAFCRRLSVITRDESGVEINKATWDLDHVTKVGKWELLIEQPSNNEIKLLNFVGVEKSGTLVTWDNVDRLLKEYADPGGVAARNALKKMVKNLKDHISMVYQRFLNTNDEREKHKVNIWLNDEQISFWDPFCEEIAGPAQEEPVKVRSDGGAALGEFVVRAFILPRKEELESSELADKAKISNDRQGFYIYRENRLIHYADWLGMYAQEPHLSLLRVEFSFNSDLDDAFQVDIKKSKISLNSALSSWVKEEFLPPVRRAAEDRYRKGQKKSFIQRSTGAHENSNRNIQNKEKDINQALVEVIDPDRNEVKITNPRGITTLKLKIEPLPKSPGELFIQPVDSIDDGLLWQPALIEQNQAVQINRGHPYYNKVYLPSILNKETSIGTIEGMDALLWALSVAELMTINQQTRGYFSDLRYEVSKILRKLVDTLPDPPEVENYGD